MEHFLGRICTSEWHAPHDRGAATADSCARLARAHPEYVEAIWAWMTRGEEMVAGVFDDTVALLTELTEAGVPCYALTNMEAETFPRRLERFAFFGLFDGIVVSGLEKMAKPDPEIFQLLLDRFGLEARSTVFIDDNLGNLRPAAALGMPTVHFRSPAGLRLTLATWGLVSSRPEESEPA
jgi:2-haloacid dehalogenase